MSIDLRGRSVSFYDDISSFPTIGSLKTLYVDRGSMQIYAWDGTTYELIDNGGGGGSSITVVANYAALLAFPPTADTFYWCQNSQGTAWLPGSLGGIYYPKGIYYCFTTSPLVIEYIETPYQATQVEVDAGVVEDKFITPKTFNDSIQLSGKVPYTGATADVDLDTFGLDAKFIKIKGTGGNGHLNLKHQSSGATAGGSESVIYADASGNPKWKNDGNAVQDVLLSGTTTADIADSTDKRYVTDAQLTVLGNTSGTNTGDQTLSGLGGVPTTRSITINGTTQDLSADRTFSAVMLTGLPGVANVGTSGALRYFTFSGVATATVETTRRIIICNNVTLRNFYIYTSTAQPATGSHVLTVLKNGVATGITVTISAGSAAGLFSDITNSETFSQGDAISIQAINNASTNSCIIVSFQIGSL